MSPDQKLEQQNISPEVKEPIEQTAETSLDSAKIEQIPKPKEEKSDEDQQTSQVVIPDDQVVAAPSSSEIVLKQVEDILSDGMDKIFLTLDPSIQKAFKIKGEETSNKIAGLLSQTKIKVGEITKLILEWLRIIPRVNKHYLEQEAKIKTEKILKINKIKNE